MRYWWVNQNKSYKYEISGGYLWSPKCKTNGSKNPFYDFMKEVVPCDIIFSFCDTYIKAIGVVQEPHWSELKPENLEEVDNDWSEEGWMVRVNFNEIPKNILRRPKDYIERLRPFLGYKYSPLNANSGEVINLYT